MPSSRKASRAPTSIRSIRQFSNERGSVSLFGDGLIELLAREMTAELRAERDEGGRGCPRERSAGDGEPVVQGRRFRQADRDARWSGRLLRTRRGRFGPHRASLQPEGRLRLAPPVRRQREQYPPRPPGERALRQALDRNRRFRRRRPSRRVVARRHLGAGRLPGDPAGAGPHGARRSGAGAMPPPAARRSSAS